MTSVDQDIDLCYELEKTMRSLQFKEEHIQFLKSNQHFVNSVQKPPYVQRTMLTMALSNLFLTGQKPTPVEIRVHLNIATDYKSWLKDIQLVVLPFLKYNEDSYFNTVTTVINA